MTCQIHKTDCQYDFDADKRRYCLLFPTGVDYFRRNPSRRYIESLEARVSSLEARLRSILDADTKTLPDIIREIRSVGDDYQYYAPAQGEASERMGPRIIT